MDSQPITHKDFRGRIGKFIISDLYLNRSPYEIIKIFSKMIVMKAEHLYYYRQTEYVAYSKLFRVIELGEQVPLYRIFYSRFGKRVSVEEVK